MLEGETDIASDSTPQDSTANRERTKLATDVIDNQRKRKALYPSARSI
jgi:hypothetical protein